MQLKNWKNEEAQIYNFLRPSILLLWILFFRLKKPILGYIFFFVKIHVKRFSQDQVLDFSHNTCQNLPVNVGIE